MEPLKQWLQPIRLWLKIFGIYLQENETKHGRKDFSMLSVANTLFWIILNFGSNALDGILLKAGSSNPNEEALETFMYNRTIDDWSWCFHSIGIQVGLLVFAKQHWPAISFLIQKIEAQFEFPEKLYRKFWQIIFFGLIHVGIMVSFLS